MSDLILITYATRAGSTEEVAEVIAETLRERGLPVAIEPVRRVHSLDGIGAVVLGAPIYMTHWHKDALAFPIHNHQELLSSSGYLPLDHSMLTKPNLSVTRPTLSVTLPRFAGSSPLC